MDQTTDQQALLTWTTDIVAAFVSNHTVATSDLPTVIKNVFEALRTADQVEAEKPAEARTPAVPIKKSITNDFLICLEDGKKVTMLKRYLRTRYNLSPDEYRRRWGLAADYPMVAPAYAEKRSALAKEIGLGRKRVMPAPAAEPAPARMEAGPPRRVGGRRRVA